MFVSTIKSRCSVCGEYVELLGDGWYGLDGFKWTDRPLGHNHVANRPPPPPRDIEEIKHPKPVAR